MRRRKLKSWVENVLVVILFISFITMACDSNNLITFITSHLISLIGFITSATLLYKYTNFFDI